MKPASQIASAALEPLQWYQAARQIRGSISYQQPSTVSGEAQGRIRGCRG